VGAKEHCAVIGLTALAQPFGDDFHAAKKFGECAR
jgi:hypothetical protein